MLAALRNKDIWTGDEESNQRHTQQHMSDRTYTEHTHVHTQKDKKPAELSIQPKPTQKNKTLQTVHLLLSLWEHGSAELHTRTDIQYTQRVGHHEREDLEHPHCAEGLFSRASRVSVCFLLLITEQYWQWLRPRGYIQLHTHIYCTAQSYSSLQHRLGNTPGAACHIYTSSSAWSCGNKDRPIFALREEAVWHKLSPTGALL